MQFIARIILTKKPPSANRYWRCSKNGNVYVTNAAKLFKEYVYLSYLAQNKKRKTIEKNEQVYIKIYWICKKKCNGGDLDNKLKILLDAMEGSVYANDNQISGIESVKLTSSDVDMMVVEIFTVKNVKIPDHIKNILQDAMEKGV